MFSTFVQLGAWCLVLGLGAWDWDWGRGAWCLGPDLELGVGFLNFSKCQKFQKRVS